MSITTSPTRRITGALLMSALIAASIWWALAGPGLIPQSTVGSVSPTPIVALPLGSLTDWARVLDNSSRGSHTVRLGSQTARIQRVDRVELVCPPKAGGCVMVTSTGRVYAARGAGARARLLARR